MYSDIQTKNVKQSFATYWQTAHAMGLPVALWRLPKQQRKQLIVSFEREIPHAKINFEELPTGFAISPFLNPDGKQTLFIEADIYCQFDGETGFEEKHKQAEMHPARIEWQKNIENGTQVNKNECGIVVEINVGQNTQQHFERMAATAIEAIGAERMQKVVLSREKKILLPFDFEAIRIFERLCDSYPNAFVSMVYLPHLNQIWLGASPETLVSIDKNGIFKTMSLAGTQSIYDENGQPKTVKQAQWTQKEIEEQAFVSRYIIDCLKKIRVREFVEEGPKTVIAGNLMHLRTDYSIDTQAIRFPELGSVMLELLHPTSAVCGLPKEPALNFIIENEGYERTFYSGFLGPVNVENESALFVNLRCMKIENQTTATLFAGAGITEDSNPAREWAETELKCQTLLGLI